MLRRSIFLLTTPTFGHMAFRTPLQKVVENEFKVTPLLGERPYPLADIARRLVRIRTKFEATDDTRERALLRGEYKYFTGKPVDLRGAAPSDLVVTLSCFGYWGFWHVPLAERIMDELLKCVTTLNHVEALELVRTLPAIVGTRAAETSLFQVAVRQLISALEDLSMDDLLSLLRGIQPCVDPLPDIADGVLLLIESSWQPGDLLSSEETALVLETIARILCYVPPPEADFNSPQSTSSYVLRRDDQPELKPRFLKFAQRLFKDVISTAEAVEPEHYGVLIEAGSKLGFLGPNPQLFCAALTSSNASAGTEGTRPVGSRRRLLDRVPAAAAEAKAILRDSLTQDKLKRIPVEGLALCAFHCGQDLADPDAGFEFLRSLVPLLELRLPAMALGELYAICRCYANALIDEVQRMRHVTRPTAAQLASPAAASGFAHLPSMMDPLVKATAMVIDRIAVMCENLEQRVDPNTTIGFLEIFADLKEAELTACSPKLRKCAHRLYERMISLCQSLTLAQSVQLILCSVRLHPFTLDAALDATLRHLQFLIPTSSRDYAAKAYELLSAEINASKCEPVNHRQVLTSATTATGINKVGQHSEEQKLAEHVIESAAKKNTLSARHLRILNEQVLPSLRARVTSLDSK
jgi:hypothetical protein